MSAAQKSQRMRIAHLTKVAERIGIDGLAVCGDEADCSFFDEYNFEGLMNEPWYERIKGNEMRMLFGTKSPQQHPRKSSSPASFNGNSSRDSLLELNQSNKRQKRKRLNSDDCEGPFLKAGVRRKSREAVGVPNKDLLQDFQDSFADEDAKELLADTIEVNTTLPEAKAQLKENLLSAFKHA